MRKRIAFIALAALGMLAFSGTASSGGTATWKVVKSKSVSGQFAVTGTSVTIGHPKGAAVRFLGSGVNGHVVWGCSKGLSIASWSRSYGRGLHILGHVRGKDSCDVIASISGQGRITVQILKLR